MRRNSSSFKIFVVAFVLSFAAGYLTARAADPTPLEVGRDIIRDGNMSRFERFLRVNRPDFHLTQQDRDLLVGEAIYRNNVAALQLVVRSGGRIPEEMRNEAVLQGKSSELQSVFKTEVAKYASEPVRVSAKPTSSMNQQVYQLVTQGDAARLDALLKQKGPKILGSMKDIEDLLLHALADNKPEVFKTIVKHTRAVPHSFFTDLSGPLKSRVISLAVEASKITESMPAKRGVGGLVATGVTTMGVSFLVAPSAAADDLSKKSLDVGEGESSLAPAKREEARSLQ